MATSIDVKDFTLTTAVTMKITSLSGGHAAWSMSQGTVASGTTDADNPLKIGAKAKSALSGLTPVSADQRVNAHSDLDGAIITRTGYCHGDIVSARVTTTANTSTAGIAAGAAGVKTYLTDVVLCNSSATAVTVDILDGATIKATIPVPAGGGAVVPFHTPIPGTAATAWNFQSSAAATTITCTMIGYQSKV